MLPRAAGPYATRHALQCAHIVRESPNGFSITANAPTDFAGVRAQAMDVLAWYRCVCNVLVAFYTYHNTCIARR